MFLQEQENHTSYSVGFDVSMTSFGVYCMPLTGDDWFGWTIGTTTKHGSDLYRVISMYNDTVDALLNLPQPPTMVTFEDYGPLGRTAGKILPRAELCGMLKQFALNTLQVPIITTSPTSLKKYATGDGKASKEAMIIRASRYGYEAPTSDDADAYFAALLGYDILRGESPECDYRRTNPVT